MPHPFYKPPEISSDIPIPPALLTGKRKKTNCGVRVSPRDTFVDTLKVGDSFLLDFPGDAQAYQKHAKKRGWRLEYQRVYAPLFNSVRVWRIS